MTTLGTSLTGVGALSASRDNRINDNSHHGHNRQALSLCLARWLAFGTHAFFLQTSRLILGAAAIETAGLKTITTYHLALAIQCLSFVRTLAPFLCSRYLPLLPPRHAAFVHNLFQKFLKEVQVRCLIFTMGFEIHPGCMYSDAACNMFLLFSH